MNKVICSICSSENFILNLKCTNCGGIIREIVRTINLGDTLRDLLLYPTLAIKKILFSEHKNYLLLLLFLLGFKLTVIFFYTNSIYDQDLGISILNLSIYVLIYWVTFTLFSGFILQVLLRIFLRQNFYYKNSLSVIMYSTSYFSILGFFLFILEMMLFGINFFSKNPDIFQVNFYKAYAVIGMELIILFYSAYLFISFLVFILQKKFIAFLLFFMFFVTILIGNEILKNIIGIN